ncbi:hypothetical protein PAAG_08943 [Paracoccidioides lutzii Pb01]|uniref:Uncharacterized protein n=1 Tax=Paracoccidioides lutzii (strain ATCC MYA-826 / Pb01) TaxID=502779 RepID=C1HDV0_PARBA|nr:hypothetical protein PAAG_08943 [Paracoccidioides lutzii Pb01]EEH40094.2 hypothetical protein PAAG_08943 [Paracoccidioides lutzii Pb01]
MEDMFNAIERRSLFAVIVKIFISSLKGLIRRGEAKERDTGAERESTAVQMRGCVKGRIVVDGGVGGVMELVRLKKKKRKKRNERKRKTKEEDDGNGVDGWKVGVEVDGREEGAAFYTSATFRVIFIRTFHHHQSPLTTTTITIKHSLLPMSFPSSPTLFTGVTNPPAWCHLGRQTLNLFKPSSAWQASSAPRSTDESLDNNTEET